MADLVKRATKSRRVERVPGEAVVGAAIVERPASDAPALLAVGLAGSVLGPLGLFASVGSAIARRFDRSRQASAASHRAELPIGRSFLVLTEIGLRVYTCGSWSEGPRSLVMSSSIAEVQELSVDRDHIRLALAGHRPYRLSCTKPHGREQLAEAYRRLRSEI